MIEDKLTSLGIKLPEALLPQGSYTQVIITGNLAFLSGQIPIDTGVLPLQVKYKGKVGKDISIEDAKNAAGLCVINGLAQLKTALQSLDRIKKNRKNIWFYKLRSLIY